jgi:putative ABC transport system permease protein
MKLFLIEVIIIGGFGSLIGIFAGTALSFVLAKGFTILKNISIDLSIFERVGIGIIGFVIGTGVCVVGALSPIQRIKKMEPLIVLKGE